MSRGNAGTPGANMNAFREGMREPGYAEGQSFAIEARYAGGKTELMPAQAVELERLGVDVIVAGPFEALQAAKPSTSRGPIIMTPSVDGDRREPRSPWRQHTGITEMMPELAAPRFASLTASSAQGAWAGVSIDGAERLLGRQCFSRQIPGRIGGNHPR